MGRCATGTFYDGRTDISGIKPYDRQILDQHVRYVGDPVAIVAGENEKCVDQAIKMLRVEYEVLPANLDPRKAMDKDTPLVHPEDNWKALCNIGADNKKNLCATEETQRRRCRCGISRLRRGCRTYISYKANQQAMMELSAVILIWNILDVL
mgnify:CR=1 FL=1